MRPGLQGAVAPVALGPVAVNDTVTTSAGHAVDVLSNDHGSGLSVTAVTQPSTGGSVTLDGGAGGVHADGRILGDYGRRSGCRCGS
jgi:hypothetical protein